MAEPTTQPSPTPKAPDLGEALTKWEALKQQGWIKPIDYAIGGVVAVMWLLTILSYVFLVPSVYTLLLTGVFTTILIQAWVVILVYRCMDFVLVTRADINLMPVAAARMAVAYFQSGQSAPPA
jgi:hypothetical protein